MRNLTSLLAGAALAALASPAGAQWYGGGYPYNAPPAPYGYGDPGYRRPLSRDVIVERLEDRGFDDVGRPRFDGSVYVVEATSRRSGAVRLVVDAYSGRVLQQSSLSVARLAPDDEGMDLDDGPAPRRRGFGPQSSEEMPNAPRWRPGEPEGAPRREAARPAEPGRPSDLGRPAEPDFAAPPTSRSRPADPRLAPDTSSGPAEPERPQRDARRPADPDAGSPPPGGVYGVNPDRRAARPAPKPKESIAARPAEQPVQAPAARTAPSAPVPSTASRPEDLKPVPPAQATAETGERRPVRVIQGVTPMNGGGAQSSPAPQNNVDAGAKPPAGQN